ncbi:MAG: serine/threonine-protein kinase [Caldilineaceae bacterium]
MTLQQGHLLQQSRYRVRKHLGQGGMGTVYLAEDQNLAGRLVAIKENSDTTPGMQRQFQREAILLARLNHPNLPRVTDHFIEASGRQYLVMDYVEGEDLRELSTRQGGPLPENAVLAWSAQVMDALVYMHQWRDPTSGKLNPIVHRDIKPANIKLNGNGRAILVDFGLAKDQTEGGTLTGARGFSPGYSPIEQYSGGTDARSDIYALGATLYQLLTGTKPPDASLRVTGTPLPPPRKLNPKLSRNTERVILRALAMQVNERFQSVQAMRAALLGSRQRESNELADTAATILPPPFQSNVMPRHSKVRLTLWGVGGTALLFLILIGWLLVTKPNWSVLPAWWPAGPTPSLHTVARNEPTPTPTATSPALAVIAPTATNILTPTAALRATATATTTPAPTPTLTPSATAPVTPTASPTPLPAPTPTVTPTLTPTHSPTPSATYTALATATPTPSATPTLLPTTAPNTAEPPPPTPFHTNGTVTLLEPLDAVLQGVRTFRWTTNLTLGPNQLFEMVFWPVGQDPMQQGFSPIGAQPQTTVTVNLDKAAAALPNLLIAGHDYAWGVLLVEKNPYRRLQYLGGGQNFRFEYSIASGGGSGSGGGGPGATATPR